MSEEKAKHPHDRNLTGSEARLKFQDEIKRWDLFSYKAGVVLILSVNRGQGTVQALRDWTMDSFWPDVEDLGEYLGNACTLQEQLAAAKVRATAMQRQGEQLAKQRGAAGVLDQVAIKLKSLTGKQNIWEAIDELAAAKAQIEELEQKGG